MVSVAFHELGHALAAAAHRVRTLSVGVFVVALFPGAYCEIDNNSAWRKCPRIYDAPAADAANLFSPSFSGSAWKALSPRQKLRVRLRCVSCSRVPSLTGQVIFCGSGDRCRSVAQSHSLRLLCGFHVGAPRSLSTVLHIRPRRQRGRPGWTSRARFACLHSHSHPITLLSPNNLRPPPPSTPSAE